MTALTGDHIFRKSTCIWGDKAVELLDRQGVEYQDHVFKSRAEEERFKQAHGVRTTPQVFLQGERIGGYDDLARHFGDAADQPPQTDTLGATSYVPVIAVFATALLLTLAVSRGVMGFMGFSLVLLACLKLMDLEAFLEGFRKYDLITQRIEFYGYLYPFAELTVGLGVLAQLWPTLVGVIAVFIGVAGGVSVFKAVYIDGTDLNCACVGGNSKVPLGTISFSENAMMALMGLALLFGWV